DAEDLDDLEDALDNEIEELEAKVLDQSSAAATIAELKAEILTLKRLEDMANEVRRSGEDAKWSQLSEVLGQDIFSRAVQANDAADSRKPTPSPHQKLVVFTEHKDTLKYLVDKI